MTRIIIAGGRDFDDWNLMVHRMGKMLMHFKQAPEIVSGTAQGADRMGERWAETQGLRVVRYPADWQRHGKSAGYKRNQEMAENAEVLCAFWDGQSWGTKHMIDIALREGLEVHVFRYNS